MHISTFAKSDSDQVQGLTQSSADAKMKHQSEATKRTKVRQKPFKDEVNIGLENLSQTDSLAKNRNSASPFSKQKQRMLR